jgi:hypothetical protein
VVEVGRAVGVGGEDAAGTDPSLAGLLMVSRYLTVLVAWINDDPAPFKLAEKVAATVDLLLEGVLRSTSPAT